MRNNYIKKIVSGGQSGVDRAALDVAIEWGIPHGGWCPFGRIAEDGVIASKYHLKETPPPSHEGNKNPELIYRKRTELNVIDSDGTLILTKGVPSGGTQYTLEKAQQNKKPYLIYNLADDGEIKTIVDWILKNNIHQLNVAGPRASQDAGIYFDAYKILEKLLKHLDL